MLGVKAVWCQSCWLRSETCTIGCVEWGCFSGSPSPVNAEPDPLPALHRKIDLLIEKQAGSVLTKGLRWFVWPPGGNQHFAWGTHYCDSREGSPYRKRHASANAMGKGGIDKTIIEEDHRLARLEVQQAWPARSESYPFWSGLWGASFPAVAQTSKVTN